MHAEALRAALWREWRDHGRLTLVLCALFALLSAMLGGAASRRALPSAAMCAALVAPFACAALPASVVDDASTGFLRLVATQPLPRGAYAALRIGATSAMLLGALAPVVLALSFLSSVSPLGALGIAALCVVWSASAAVYLGLLFRSPGAATGVWVLLCVANLLAVLATWPGMSMVDLLVRARHALPGAASVEALVTDADPWAWGAPVVLALETLIALAAATLRPRGAKSAATFALALGLPFVLPAGGR